MAVLRWQQIATDTSLSTELLTGFGAIAEALQNNLDSPKALALLSGIETTVTNSLVGANDHQSFELFISQLDMLLGLQLSAVPDISDTQKKLIEDRQQAREQKDWTQSDTIRSQLLDQNITVRDTDHGQIWSWVG